MSNARALESEQEAAEDQRSARGLVPVQILTEYQGRERRGHKRKKSMKITVRLSPASDPTGPKPAPVDVFHQSVESIPLPHIAPSRPIRRDGVTSI